GGPSFVVESAGQRRLIFGQDRLHFVEQAIRGHLGETVTGTFPLADDTRTPRPVTPREIRFFYDFSSPFTYLASTQIERVAAEQGAQIEWYPILLGALF